MSGFKLNFENKHIEDEFLLKKENKINFYLKIQSIILFIVGLLASIINPIYLSDYENNTLTKVTIITSHICSFYYFIIIFIVINCKNKTILKYINFINYFSLLFLFTNLRYPIFVLTKYEALFLNIIINLEIIVRLFWMIAGILSFYENFILNLITIIISMIIYPTTAGPLTELMIYSCLAYSVIFSLIMVISYYIERQTKTAFYFWSKANDKAEWLSNVLDNINTGYISIKNSEVTYINSFLKKQIFKLKYFKNEKNDNNDNFKTESNLFIKIENENNEPIMKETNLYRIYCPDKPINSDTLTTIQISKDPNFILYFILSNLNIDPKNDSDLNKVLSEFKMELEEVEDNCKNKNDKKNNNFIDNFKMALKSILAINSFLLIGDINLEIEDYENSFEIHIRLNFNSNDESELEFLFNDVTRTKLREKQNAEFTYKTFFLSKIAHEFKNPLICITELVNQLNDTSNNYSIMKMDDNKEVMSKLNQIKSMSNFLLILVKDLNYFAQMQDHKNITLDIAECKVEEVLDFCKGITNSLLRKTNKLEIVEFKSKIDDYVPKLITTDEWRLKQVLINLLSNAVKFTLYGEINLEITRERRNEIDLIKFLVNDTGPGINDEQKKNMFQPFSKGKDLNNQLGSGLGLSIANEIAAELGEKVEFSSELGKGTNFWFRVASHSNNQSTIENCEEKSSKKCLIKKEPNKYLDLQYNQNKIFASNESYSIDNSTVTRQVDFERLKHASIENRNFETNLVLEYKSENIISNKFTNDVINILPNDSIKFVTNKINKKCYTASDVININQDIDQLRKQNSINVLVADDENLTRQYSIRNLKIIAKELNLNVNIIEAEDGIESAYLVCKLLAIGIKISMIFSDENMNFVNGLRSSEFIFEIIERKRIPQIPFYLVTAMDNSLCKDFHISYIRKVLPKPLTKEIIKSLIIEYCEL